ncbi:MAG: cytochrome b [Acetobacteraceae bacterium]|nr:cytochrome b [Acetobacteraceae bacterium]
MSSDIWREPASTQGLRHAPTTIALHWLTAITVLLLWGIGQTVDLAPNGPLRVDYRSAHILLGLVLGLLIAFRLLWRAARGGMLPPLDSGLLLIMARITHWALYGLMICTVVLGVAYVWARGDSIFNLFAIPQLSPGNKPLIHQIGGWHALAANTVLIVAGLHAAAGLFHHYAMRDDTLRRMLPRARSGSPGGARAEPKP